MSRTRPPSAGACWSTAGRLRAVLAERGGADLPLAEAGERCSTTIWWTSAKPLRLLDLARRPGGEDGSITRYRTQREAIQGCPAAPRKRLGYACGATAAAAVELNLRGDHCQGPASARGSQGTTGGIQLNIDGFQIWIAKT
nr:hypothetical protein [Pseudomonas aeruginosa]